jgi:hypothetical protein
MSWGYLSLALLLFAMAGLLIASAVYDGAGLAWATAVLALLLGALSAAAAVAEPRRRRVEPESSTKWDPSAAPRLGEMLASYGLISEADLEQALERQAGSGKRLGQVLVEMELVTHAQVAQVLEEQLSRREGRLLWGVGAELVE